MCYAHKYPDYFCLWPFHGQTQQVKDYQLIIFGVMFVDGLLTDDVKQPPDGLQKLLPVSVRIQVPWANFNGT